MSSAASSIIDLARDHQRDGEIVQDESHDGSDPSLTRWGGVDHRGDETNRATEQERIHPEIDDRGCDESGVAREPWEESLAAELPPKSPVLDVLLQAEKHRGHGGGEQEL